MADTSSGNMAAVDEKTRGQMVNRDNERFGPPDSKMYPAAVALRPAYKARDEELAIGLGLTEAQRAERYIKHTQVIDASGLPAADIGRRLFDLALDADLAEARGEATDGSGDGPRLPEEARLQEEVRAQLASQYGLEHVEPLLERAKKFIADQPALAALMRRNNIGNRPDVVGAVVAHVRSIGFK